MLAFLFSSFFTLSSVGLAQQAPEVRFVHPRPGDTLPTTFAVRFNGEGVRIQPAGKAPRERGRSREQAGRIPSGHYHLIIDGGPVPEGQIIPTDDRHIHYGKGQTGGVVTVAPGQHTLTVQLADGEHRSYGPKLSETLTIVAR